MAKPPGASGEQPVFYHQIGAKQQSLVRLGLGVAPSMAADLLVSALDDLAVVHGRGKDGRLHIDGVAVSTDWLHGQLNAVTDPDWEVVLLASDSDKTAQELADARQTTVWAPPPRATGRMRLADLWVSLGTGAVAVGAGGLTADGKLQISPTPLHRYEPRPRASSASPRGSTRTSQRAAAAAQGQAGLPPVRTLTEAQALADRGPWQRRTARMPAGPLDWEDHTTREGLPVSIGRDDGVIRQVLMLTPEENIASDARAAAEKMIFPDEVTAAVHIHGRPGQGPGLAAGQLAAVVDSLGLPRRPVWLVSSGAADSGKASYAQEFATAWNQWVIAGRKLTWVRLDGVVVASSQRYGQAGPAQPPDPPDGQHQKFFPNWATPASLGPVLLPLPWGTTLGDGPWQRRLLLPPIDPMITY